MPKIDVNTVAEILKKNQLDPKLLRQVIEEMNLAAQPEGAEGEKVPAVKKQFVVLASDPDNRLPKHDFVAWVLQIPEDESVATTQDRIYRGAYDYNASKKGRLYPAKTVGELTRLLDKGEKVKINFNDRRAAFQIATDKDTSGLIDSVYLYSKVVEGNYPNYQQVVPKETHQRIKLERELLLQCVHRAQLVCSEKANSVKIKLSSNLLEIFAASSDFGEAHESMAIGYSGPDLQVAFNPAFLMDPLKALTKDEVFFEVKDEVSPGVFKTLESFICVIMPVRLS